MSTKTLIIACLILCPLAFAWGRETVREEVMQLQAELLTCQKYLNTCIVTKHCVYPDGSPDLSSLAE